MTTSPVILKPEDEHLIADFEAAGKRVQQFAAASETHRVQNGGEISEVLYEQMMAAMHEQWRIRDLILTKGHQV